MKKNIETTFSVVKCDNPNCDWKHTLANTSEMADWVNVPCPKCGTKVLTENDLKSFERMQKLIEGINELDLSVLESKLPEELRDMMLKTKMVSDGKGGLRMTEIKEHIED